MSPFVEWKTYRSAHLSNTPHELLVADTYYIVVNSIKVTNTAAKDGQPILVTLQEIRTTEGTPDTVLSIVAPKERVIAPSATVDILDGDFITLEYINETPISVDSLKIFSYGPTQFFDCSVNYMLLKELPAL